MASTEESWTIRMCTVLLFWQDTWMSLLIDSSMFFVTASQTQLASNCKHRTGAFGAYMRFAGTRAVPVSDMSVFRSMTWRLNMAVFKQFITTKTIFRRTLSCQLLQCFQWRCREEIQNKKTRPLSGLLQNARGRAELTRGRRRCRRNFEGEFLPTQCRVLTQSTNTVGD